MKFLLALSLLISATCRAQGYDLEVMRNHLAGLKDLTSLPTYEFKTEMDQEELADSVPEWILEKSILLQNNVFGHNLITIKMCDFDGAVMIAEYTKRTICVSASDLEELSEMLTETQLRSFVSFVLAHELSHFVHEISTHVRPPFERSLNNTVSAYRFTFDGFVQEQCGHTDWARLFDRLPVLTKKAIGIAADMHAEVDTYAYLILESSGVTLPVDEIKFFFEKIQNESKEAGNDGPRRLKGLENFLKTRTS